MALETASFWGVLTVGIVLAHSLTPRAVRLLVGPFPGGEGNGGAALRVK